MRNTQRISFTMAFVLAVVLPGCAGDAGTSSTLGDSPKNAGTSMPSGSSSSTPSSSLPTATPTTGTTASFAPVPSGSTGTTSTSTSTTTTKSSGAFAPVPSVPEGTTPTPVVAPLPTAGQLTAGTWDDNLNYDFFTKYAAAYTASQPAGMPLIEVTARLNIQVLTADREPVAGAKVDVVDAAGHAFHAITGADGRILYFPGWNGVARDASVTITAGLAEDEATLTTPATPGTVELILPRATRAAVDGLDLAFIIDATGSMTDELKYLQAEIDSIAAGVAKAFPQVAQRFALIMYRDEGDAYILRTFDFTTNLATFRQNLADQSALNGGDYPEAVDQALLAATRLSWQAGAVARMAFWIADAPHHAGKEAIVASALDSAVAKGVHLYPIAASGLNDLGEFTMRAAALVTGGRYLFLTNDSGIGGSHQEPHLPCYYVTSLVSAMQRVVAAELSGSYVPPAPAEILRLGGNPENQLCTLSTGTVVTAW